MSMLEQTTESIVAPDPSIGDHLQEILDLKTKPRGSLGRLENLARQLAVVYGRVDLHAPRKTMVVMAADHGVSKEGVSAYPQEVTAQMVRNFSRGGAAINVLAKRAGAEVLIVDMGVKGLEEDLPGVRYVHIAHGTKNMTMEPAMTRAQAERALEAGIQIAHALEEQGVELIGLGDMGIGNTTASSAITAVLLGLLSEEVTGRGTGIDDAGLQKKRNVIHQAIQVTQPDAQDAVDVLARVGGFEIAGLAGVILGAAARRLAVLLDGFITGAAALVAVGMAPKVNDYLIASHCSEELAHSKILEALHKKPLLDLALRLGEGTGAALAMPLVDAAVAVINEMAGFDAAGVTDTGR